MTAKYFTQQGIAKGETRRITIVEAVYEAIGEAKKGREVALKALKKDLPIELVADLTGLDIKIVEQIKQELDKG